MADETPRLRLVDPSERASEPVGPGAPPPAPDERERHEEHDEHEEPGRSVAWVSTILPLCIGLAVLAIGLAVSLRLLLPPPDDDDRVDTAQDTEQPVASDIVTTVPAPAPTTAVPPGSPADPATTSPAPAPGVDRTPGLVPLPVDGGAPAATPPATVPVTGAVNIRVFNGYLPGQPLEVWDVASGTPVRYGTVPYTGLSGMVAGGALLPGGVGLQLRFVRPGGDPMAAPGSNVGSWDFTPPDGSSQTLMLTDNGGLRVLRIDNLRALRAVPAGRVHVVPVVTHLLLDDTRTKQWARDGVGCLGVSTVDKVEFDVDVGAALRLAEEDDPTCNAAVSDAVVAAPSTAIAVVGIEVSPGRAQLIAVPLG